MATNAKGVLDSYHFNILKDMVTLFMIPLDSSRKQDHMDVLVPLLFTQAAVQKGLTLLGKREKEALAAIQRAGGKMTTVRLRQQLVRQRVVQEQDTKQLGGYYGPQVNVRTSEQHRTDFRSVLGRLIATGLVCAQDKTANDYTTRTKIYYDNYQTIYIPPEVQRWLDAPPPLVQEVFTSQTLARIDKSSARTFQRDLYLYWSIVHAESPKLTTQKRLYKKDLKRINEALQQPENLNGKDELDVPRLIFMRRLMVALGILKQTETAIEAPDQPKFLSQNPTTRVERTLKAWRDGNFWNEMLSIANISTYSLGTRLDDVPEPVVRARKMVLNHIVALYKNDWTLIDTLIDSIRMADYNFLLPRDYKPTHSYYYYSYTSQSPYSSYGNAMHWDLGLRTSDESEGWELVEANLIRNVLLQPLYWMGLVDIGYADDVPLAYRLTPMGAWVLGVGGEVDIPEGEGKVIVQPNYEIIAMDPISDMALARLDEFADRISAERAMQYVLTRESVYRAQKKGWTVARIIDTLQKMSDKPLPQNVMRTLQEWQALHERITIHRKATVLQVVDAQLTNRLCEMIPIKSHITTRLGDTVVMVAPEPGKAEELMLTLQELGYLPARTRTLQDVLRPSLTIAATARSTVRDNQLIFHEALPSIYLFGQVAPFTDQDAQQCYFLTEQAVQRALQNGYTVTKILDTLRTLHIGPLPRRVEIQVRAWGHYYGDAAIQPLVLVQIRDEATLKELMQEPELQELVQPFNPHQQKALAVVPMDKLDMLRQALVERGISLKDQLE